MKYAFFLALGGFIIGAFALHIRTIHPQLPSNPLACSAPANPVQNILSAVGQPLPLPSSKP